MAAKLLFPDDVRQQVLRRYRLQHRAWLIGDATWPFSIPLGAPTERDVSGDSAHARAWIDAWRGFQPPSQVTWTAVQWRRLGQQQLPSRLELPSPAAAARLVGEHARFERALERYEELVRRWPQLARSRTIARYFDTLADAPESDHTRLIALLAWLLANPRSGYAVRELPVPGIDTKWTEKRQTLVMELFQVLRGDGCEGDFFAVCGLRRPAQRLRAVLLCPELRATIGGLRDIQVPIDALARLAIEPRCVLVIENLQTGLALPDIAGAIALVGLGNAATSIAALRWTAGARVLYWGDIDSHGLAILNRVRGALGTVQAILMCEHTLLRYRDLWVEEATQCSERELPYLLPAERDVFEGLIQDRWGSRVRLEQERLPWDAAMRALREAVDGR